MAHSSNPVLTGLLLAEMYKEVAKSQPTHKHTLLHNCDIIGKVAFTMLDSVREEVRNRASRRCRCFKQRACSRI